MFDVQVFGVSVVGTIIAIVTLLKDVGFPTKYAPFVAVALGIMAGVFLVDPTDLKHGIVTGLALGLSSVGVHSGVKNVKEGILELIKKPEQADQQQVQQ